MKCEDVIRRLDDHLDGRLPEDDRRRVEAHLEECPGCRREAEELRALTEAAAALPRSLAPARELWPGIAKRIGEHRLVGASFGRGATWRRSLRFAAAAAAVVAVTSIVTFSLIHHGENGPLAARPSLQQPTPAGLRLVSLGGVGADLRAARNELLAALDQRSTSMSPETRAVIDDNLRVIDEAIRHIEAALEEDPDNRHLTTLLAATCRQESQLLQRATRLPAET